MKKIYLQPEVDFIGTGEDVICTSGLDKNETDPMPLFGDGKNGFGNL